MGSVSGRPLAPTPGRPHFKRDSPQGFTSTDYRSRDMSSCPLRARRGRLAEPPITPHFPPPATRPFEYRNRTHTSPLSISLPALSPLKNKAIVRKPSLYPQRLALHYPPSADLHTTALHKARARAASVATTEKDSTRLHTLAAHIHPPPDNPSLEAWRSARVRPGARWTSATLSSASARHRRHGE